MRGMTAFLKKEFLALKRSKKFYISLGVFALFAVLDVLLTILTPKLFDLLSDQMAEMGMSMAPIEADSPLCWQEFNENFAVMLIVFIVMFAGIMTDEYKKGTLVLVFTKGMSKKAVFISKFISLLTSWTCGFFVMTAITAICSACIWDNSVMHNMPQSLLCMWLVGIAACCLIMCFSTFCNGMGGILLWIGCVAFTCILLNIIPKASKFLPTSLLDTTSVMCGYSEIQIPSVLITIAICIISVVLGIFKFDKRDL